MTKKKNIYLDYAATTPVDPLVIAQMQPYFNELFFNPSSPYSFACEVKNEVKKAREGIASFINAGFEVITDEVGRWPMLPTHWVHIDKQFKAVPEEEISIRSFHITLRPSVQQTDSQ